MKTVQLGCTALHLSSDCVQCERIDILPAQQTSDSPVKWLDLNKTGYRVTAPVLQHSSPA